MCRVFFFRVNGVRPRPLVSVVGCSTTNRAAARARNRLSCFIVYAFGRACVPVIVAPTAAVRLRCDAGALMTPCTSTSPLLPTSESPLALLFPAPLLRFSPRASSGF